ncbi:recQ-mediated genome instability protein 1-like isoform X2 [Odontomachus brunneus]|nr:recQ-mediated genome instability protein 1-like isoform X2 [Odontomachus brunneus]
MYDIASSKYKQLCHIRKVNSDNLEITENEKLNEWEPKGRRMMQLCLTDGVQDITAIEYTPLKQVMGTLLPGYKVMIIGPVNCRRGIILLEENKYREIGGEVESMLKPNALENVLSRALDEPENPDPYHDNGLIKNQNNQDLSSNPTNEDNFFDDDFEEAVDLEAVTEIERQSSQEAVRTVQNCPTNTREQRQNTQTVGNDTAEEFLEDIDFEPLEDWSSEDARIRPLRVLPSSRVKTGGFEEEDDLMIIEETSISAQNSRNEPSFPAKSCKNEDITDFPDDDFDFNDCEIIVNTESKAICQEQSGNSFNIKSKTGVCSSLGISRPRLMNDVTMEVEKCTSVEVLTTRNEKSMASTSTFVQKIPKTKTITDFFVPPSPPKIYVLSDVLRENVTGTIYRTVRAHVTNHSTLTKQGKCWAVTAQITDNTSSVEVCFDSEILEKFLGFTVQEFSHKKKLAKSDQQVNNELRLSLRKAQHQIASLDALLKLELTQDQIPKVVEITQQKKELTKRSA